MTHYTNIDFKHKDSKILQDPITPHDNKFGDVLKTKKISMINNVVCEK